MSTLRIGLLGGSFDPIHKGHLELAKAILKNGCHEVWFIPCQSSPLKERGLSNFEDRVNMIKWAIKPFKKMKVCEIEKELPVPSYTVNTLRELKKKYDHEFIFYIGYDQANQLHKWKDIDECMKMAEFRVIKRGEEYSCIYDLKEVEFKAMDISSTKVRQGAFYDVPSSVRNYIWDHRLYLKEFVKASVDEKRYNHSLCVADVCVELARVHKLNVEDAYVIGILHDVCKKWSYEKMEAWMKCYESKNLDKIHLIWHAFVADHYLKHKFKIKETHILHAINNHGIGDSSNPYAQIAFIADKCEPSRGYDASREMNAARKDLSLAMKIVHQTQDEYIKRSQING